MHCHKASEYMSLWLDRLLTPAEAEVLQTHLAECPQCRQAWERLQRVSAFLESVPRARPGSGFTAHVMSRISRYETQQKRLRGLIHLGLAWAMLWITVLFALNAVLILQWWSGHLPIAPLISLIPYLGDPAATVINMLGLLGKVALLLLTGLWSEKGVMLIGIYSLLAFGLVTLWARLVASCQRRTRAIEAIG